MYGRFCSNQKGSCQNVIAFKWIYPSARLTFHCSAFSTVLFLTFPFTVVAVQTFCMLTLCIQHTLYIPWCLWLHFYLYFHRKLKYVINNVL
jgi:hypothetical protein